MQATLERTWPKMDPRSGQDGVAARLSLRLHAVASSLPSSSPRLTSTAIGSASQRRMSCRAGTHLPSDAAAGASLDRLGAAAGDMAKLGRAAPTSASVGSARSPALLRMRDAYRRAGCAMLGALDALGLAGTTSVIVQGDHGFRWGVTTAGPSTTCTRTPRASRPLRCPAEELPCRRRCREPRRDADHPRPVG